MINRAEPTTTLVRGTVDVTVLGQKKSLPFELNGTLQTVGTISVTMHSHLEPVNPSDARFLNNGMGWQGNRGGWNE